MSTPGMPVMPMPDYELRLRSITGLLKGRLSESIPVGPTGYVSMIVRLNQY
jgi:hypothetical protein